jgi:hypothetical protein
MFANIEIGLPVIPDARFPILVVRNSGDVVKGIAAE